MDEPQAAETPRLTGMALDNAVMRARIETLTRSGIIEVALQNPNVMSYMEEWETRAEKAERLAANLADCLEDIVSHYVDICGANTSESWDAMAEEEVIAAGKLIAQARLALPSPQQQEMK